MTTNLPRHPAPMPKDFAQAYTTALGSILRFEENKANHTLNAVFTLAGSFRPADNMWQTIQADLADQRTRGLLYGDYQSDSPHPCVDQGTQDSGHDRAPRRYAGRRQRRC